jgi:cbb3-type cytochrome oxidase maturation protein
MNIIHLMVPMALMLGGGFLVSFIWMARHGQYDDLETPAHRILLEDEE